MRSGRLGTRPASSTSTRILEFSALVGLLKTGWGSFSVTTLICLVTNSGGIVKLEELKIMQIRSLLACFPRSELRHSGLEASRCSPGHFRGLPVPSLLFRTYNSTELTIPLNL